MNIVYLLAFPCYVRLAVADLRGVFHRPEYPKIW
jgi:hypothetical protein